MYERKCCSAFGYESNSLNASTGAQEGRERHAMRTVRYLHRLSWNPSWRRSDRVTLIGRWVLAAARVAGEG